MSALRFGLRLLVVLGWVLLIAGVITVGVSIWGAR